MVDIGESGILPFLKKKNWQYAPVSKLYKGVPLFRNSILSKSSYAWSNLKKKTWNSILGRSSSKTPL